VDKNDIKMALSLIEYHKSFSYALLHVSHFQETGFWSSTTSRRIGGIIFSLKRIARQHER